MGQHLHADEASWGALLSGRNGMLALVLTGGVALHAINIYLTTTLLPTIVSDIGGLSFYAWNTTLFVVASIIGTVLASRFLQRGVYFAYGLAAGFMFLGCLIASLAPSMPVLLAGRFLQGLGGGAFIALSYAMIPLVFEEKLWSRAFALTSGMWGVATLCGPAVGGLFAEYSDWRTAFMVMLPILIVYVVLVIKMLPASKDESSVNGLPVWQLLFLIIAVLSISLASTAKALSIQGGYLLIALVGFVFLVLQEKRSENKLLPTDVLKPSSTLFAIYLTFFLLLASSSSEIFMPYFLQNLHLLSPLAAGYIAALKALGWSLSELYSARFMDEKAERIVQYSPALIVLGLALMFVIVPETSDQSIASLVLISVALLIAGFGIGAAWPHLTTFALAAAPKEEQALTASSMTTVMMFASAFGSAVAGMIANVRGFNTSFEQVIVADAALWLFASFVFVAIAALIVSQFVVRRRGKYIRAQQVINYNTGT